MRYGSLCSGIGGLDLAVEAVFDATPAWFCEKDPAAVSVLRRWWPGVPVLEDLKTEDWTQVEPVDLVAAGYPCQPFSQAGRRLGADDPRHLWPYVLAAVRVLRPEFVVLENVSGHLRLGFDVVLGDLAEAGFNAEWVVVRASDAGACHQRARLFVVAQSAGGSDGGGLAWGEHLRPVAHTSGERFGEHPGEPSAEEAGTDEGHVVDVDGARRAAANTDRVVGAASESFTGRPGAVDEPGAVERAIGLRGMEDAADTAGNTRGVSDRDRSATADADRGRLEECGQPNGGTVELGLEASRRGDVDGRDASTAWGDYGPAIERWGHVTGRPAPLPTIDGRLAVPFVEWMQGFPEGWVDGLTRTAALRCLGNAVVPLQGALALRQLVAL